MPTEAPILERIKQRKQRTPDEIEKDRQLAADLLDRVPVAEEAFWGALPHLLAEKAREYDSRDTAGLIQDTTLRIWEALQRGVYKPERASLFSFAFIVMHNVWVDNLRMAAVRPVEVPPEEPVIELSYDHIGDYVAERVDLVHNFSQLNLNGRRHLFDSAIMGLTYQEIAKIEGRPLGTIKTRILAAKYKLRELLTPVTDY